MKYIFLLLTVSFFACGEEAGNDPQQRIDTPPGDSAYLEKIRNSENLTSPSLQQSIDAVKENFKRLNSVKEWTRIETRELDESTEGGVAKYYYSGDTVAKIVAKHYGETYQQLNEYYLSENGLSFALEKNCRYNRPMYYDSIAMKDNNDTEMFDFDKSKITESRTYFKNGKLLLQENSEDYEKPSGETNAEETAKRILSEVERLLLLVKKQ